MAMEYKNGLMEQIMSGNGKTINPMEKVNSLIPMAITMKDTGKIIKHMAKEFIIEPMGATMMAIGLMINHMVLACKNGETEIFIKDRFFQVKKKEKAHTDGQMVQCILANGDKEKLMVMDSTDTLMEEFMKENGKTI